MNLTDLLGQVTDSAGTIITAINSGRNTSTAPAPVATSPGAEQAARLASDRKTQWMMFGGAALLITALFAFVFMRGK